MLINSIANTFSSSKRNSGGSGSSGDTTPDGKQAFLIIGESHAAGNSDPGTGLPDAITNQVFQVNAAGTVVSAIVGKRINGDTGGSPWVQFANDYYTSTGKNVVLVPTAIGGSTAFTDPTQPTNTWYTTSNLYSNAVTKGNATLTTLGLTKFKAIFIILGTNDSQSSATLADVATGMDSLISRLVADYPNTDIVWAPTGWISGNGLTYVPENISTVRTRFIRKKNQELARDNANVFIGPILASYAQNSLNRAANVHYSDAGNIEIGRMFNRWMQNSSYGKEARSIICSHYDELSTGRKTAINQLVIDYGTTEWYRADGIQNFCTTIRSNVFIDFKGQTGPTDRGSGTNLLPFVFTANSHIGGDGVGVSVSSNLLPSTGASVYAYSSLDSMTFLVKLKENRSDNLLTCLFGGGTSVGSINIRQLAAAAGPSWRANCITSNTFAAEGDLDDNTVYGVRRTSAASQDLLKGSTVISNLTTASTAVSPETIYLLSRISAGALVATEYMNADIEWCVLTTGTADVSRIINAMTTFQTSWKLG
jgi:hypothetical protein